MLTFFVFLVFFSKEASLVSVLCLLEAPYHLSKYYFNKYFKLNGIMNFVL